MADVPEVQLTDGFKPDEISWRVGSTNNENTRGMALPYIDARTVAERLDAVVGPMGWSSEYSFEGVRTICTISIWDDERKHWVSKSDGAGDTDFEAEKGALSDSFKRAGVKWGIGRPLYAMDAPWVAIEKKGRSYTIVKSEMGNLDAIAAGKKPKPPRKPPATGTTAKPKSNGKAKDKAKVNPADGPDGDTPPGVQLLGLMRSRCGELGRKDDQAGAILNQIILVDLALEKSPECFAENWEAIVAKVSEWLPTDG